MTNVNKMRIQLEKINGSQTKSEINNVHCKISVNDKFPSLDLSIFTVEQICQQACAGNKDFIIELIRRAEEQEIEGDYIMANELYKKFTKGFIS
ncbi:hypothetical protein [Thalassomonas sp. M1454]|uniref:hypothetical protein n=1 Tax=Thalassomonas sp. M1454 TaxID=2594477 RepID=UPI0011805DC8|nr:hypothetical protein [Thalassomonas sp. M1454]TRX57036.1 hypothetical protein FNN08_05925 [Thalassomonas sp. M1454]